MKMKTTGMMAAVSLCALAGVAQAQLKLAIDVQSAYFEFFDEVGGGPVVPTLGAGTGHTGTLELTHDGAAFLHGITKQIGAGPEIGQTSTASLDDIKDFGAASTKAIIEFEDGWVKSGSFRLELDNGDWYQAKLVADSGFIQASGAGFEINGLTFAGEFSGSTFSGVDIQPWWDAQQLAGLLGNVVNLESDTTAAFGYSNLEVYVLVPLPPAAYAGFGMLAGVMGLSYVLRRR